MTRLNDLLPEDLQTSDARLALELAREDQTLLATLVAKRNELGLSQADLAEKIGISQATVSAFERIGNDPHLSTVRRYARAVGLVIRHHTSTHDEVFDSEFLSHVTPGGVESQQTAAAVARALQSNHKVSWPTSATDRAGSRPVEACEVAKSVEKIRA